MAAGRVSEIVDVTEGNDLGTYVKVQSDGFHITYGHLAEVDQGLVNEYNNTATVNPRVNQGQRIGTAGETGNADGVHLHAQLKPDYPTEIPANHKHIGGAVNFQQYLPAGHYHWPDIEALQAEINDALEADRDDLGRVIDHWMDNVLQGEVDPRQGAPDGHARKTRLHAPAGGRKLRVSLSAILGQCHCRHEPGDVGSVPFPDVHGCHPHSGMVADPDQTRRSRPVGYATKTPRKLETGARRACPRRPCRRICRGSCKRLQAKMCGVPRERIWR